MLVLRLFNSYINLREYPSINQSINQSINHSINAFEEEIQTVQFTNMYKHIIFLHDILIMIIMIMKTNKPLV